MILESGFIVFIGLLLIAVKIPKPALLRILGWPLVLDITVSVLAFVMHMGTFSGVMAAAVAGLLTSGMSSFARWAVGYIDSGKYYPGRLADWRQHAIRTRRTQ